MSSEAWRKGRKIIPKRSTCKDVRLLADFDGFYAAYPIKRAPDRAFRRYQERRADGVLAKDLLQAATNYAASCAEQCLEKKFIPYPEGWLNSGDYEEWIDWKPRRTVQPGSPVDDTPIETTDFADHPSPVMRERYAAFLKRKAKR